MNLALRTLLAGVVDYAGLFPPARLPLDAAVRDFAEFRSHQDAWMLRHFVIPAQQLSALTHYADDLSSGANRWTLSVLGRLCQTWDEWKTVLEDDLRLITEFAEENCELASVTTLELPLPGEFSAHAATQRTTGECLDELAGAIVQHDLHPEMVFIEVPSGDAAEESRETLSRCIGERGDDDLPFGLKLRTGGVERAAFPSVEQLARMIDSFQQHGITWKATAGLHHPLPRYCSEVGTTMHGFLNLLVAVALANSGPLSRTMLEQVLQEENADNFAFDNEGLSWRDCNAPLPAIEAAREQFVSFGSCSFDDPRNGLLKMGYELTTVLPRSSASATMKR